MTYCTAVYAENSLHSITDDTIDFVVIISVHVFTHDFGQNTPKAQILLHQDQDLETNQASPVHVLTKHV